MTKPQTAPNACPVQTVRIQGFAPTDFFGASALASKGNTRLSRTMPAMQSSCDGVVFMADLN